VVVVSVGQLACRDITFDGDDEQVAARIDEALTVPPVLQALNHSEWFRGRTITNYHRSRWVGRFVDNARDEGDVSTTR
jgi:hypothetical protein